MIGPITARARRGRQTWCVLLVRSSCLAKRISVVQNVQPLRSVQIVQDGQTVQAVSN